MLDIEGNDGGSSVVFPARGVTASRKFIDAEAQPSFRDMIAAGGFAVDALQLRVSLEGLRNQRITVHNVRVSGLRREDIPTGALVKIPGQGVPTNQMAFAMDAAKPVAHQVVEGVEVDRAFFDNEFIDLADGEKTVLVLRFHTELWAYAFDVAIDYEIGGRLLTQPVPRTTDQPYRVAAGVCFGDSFLAKLSSADRQRLGSLRYNEISEVAGMAVEADGSQHYRMERADPARHCAG
ncbi:hypothetical protein [Actinoplanes sp. NBRC 103695]|uniref:hypothetical protein n=1 Tax=Actinoplanes sp. NBRC 103695 TaxID=3032202 RepID=UPI002555A250|nr:hypothetical protein [Actinoplanes sp. NBRC 103695]